MKRSGRIILIVISIVMMFMGAIIYLFFNHTAYFVGVIDPFIPPIPLMNQDGMAGIIIRNFGADFLWSAAFTLTLQAILYLKRNKIRFLLLSSMLGGLYELMQFLGVINGTADIADLIIYFAGCILGIIIIIGGKFYEKE